MLQCAGHLHFMSNCVTDWQERHHLLYSSSSRTRIYVIGASLSEPHIVVISITFSCPTPYVRTRTRPTSVDPIAYNRISTWKTGILRARAGNYAVPACHLRAPSIRPAYELTAQAAWILLAQSTSAVPQSTQAECARCCRDKYALKVSALLFWSATSTARVVYRRVLENGRYLELFFP